jgi:energy-coupling factor transporter ATP-binding protein EcfA2
MILKAFRIKNYRSIIDTGWNNLSPDNVTALIGQNESGKTSVLEALKSFYDGAITDDILRSDLSMPEVSCVFKVENESEYPVPSKIFPEGVIEKIQKTGEVTLVRSWQDLQSSKLALNGDDIINLYKDFDSYWDKLDKVVSDTQATFSEKSKTLAEEVESLDQLLAKYKMSIESLVDKTGDIERQMRKLSDEPKKELMEKEISLIGIEISKIEQQIEKTKNEQKAIRDALSTANTILNISSACSELMEKVDMASQRVDYAYTDLMAEEKKFEIARGNREQRNIAKKIEQFKSLYIQSTGDYEVLKRELKLLQFELKHLCDGKDEFDAKRLAENDFNHFDKVCSREDAALIFFENIPHFELFEDFSSLLPNKIDLEDLFHEHTLAEGYKAVKNFLVIAGLEPHFFTQTNNRILKQKIENLNNELTVNFQDYWGQCIGKTNKIQIAFELEHYDFQNPEKMGKPYLEFWIKDEQERLYPKQRSRGVRWFLSFYLELKASARKYGGKNRVLLIDEPGLSLHARAQEDVLKVFDDIRDKLQVVYTTHSPNLIDSKKLFRILAVQRSHDMDNSETVLFDASSLHSAAQDTLFPIYALMGVQLSENHFIRKKNNVIVEDIATFYYLSAMLPMTGYKKEISFIPATGGQSLQLLSNLMLGWGLDYSILVFGNDHVNDQIEELKKNLKPLENPEDYRVLHLQSFSMVEDLFSTLDFKKHIINQRIGIPESNGEFIHDNKLSRVVLANSLAQKVKSNILKFSDFDDETKSNFKMLAQRLDGQLP